MPIPPTLRGPFADASPTPRGGDPKKAGIVRGNCALPSTSSAVSPRRFSADTCLFAYIGEHFRMNRPVPKKLSPAAAEKPPPPEVPKKKAVPAPLYALRTRRRRP